MKLYRFDPNTFIYIGSVEAELDEFESSIKGSPVYKGQASSTFIEPTFESGYIPFYKNNEWVNVPYDDPSITKIYSDVVQEYMDKKVSELGYDNVFTCISYTNSTNPKYKAEAEAVIAWRDAVWEKCFELLANVTQSENISIPTKEEIIEVLPELKW